MTKPVQQPERGLFPHQIMVLACMLQHDRLVRRLYFSDDRAYVQYTDRKLEQYSRQGKEWRRV